MSARCRRVARARKAALGLKRLTPRPARVLVSPLRRARETAAILTRLAGWPGAAQCVQLRPGASPESLLALLARTRERRLAVVGHEPGLDVPTPRRACPAGKRRRRSSSRKMVSCCPAVLPGFGARRARPAHRAPAAENAARGARKRRSVGSGGGRGARWPPQQQVAPAHERDQAEEQQPRPRAEDVIRSISHERLGVDHAVEQRRSSDPWPMPPACRLPSACAVTGSFGVRCSTSWAWWSKAQLVPDGGGDGRRSVDPAVMRAKLNKPEAAGLALGRSPEERYGHQRNEKRRHACALNHGRQASVCRR